MNPSGLAMRLELSPALSDRDNIVSICLTRLADSIYLSFSFLFAVPASPCSRQFLTLITTLSLSHSHDSQESNEFIVLRFLSLSLWYSLVYHAPPIGFVTTLDCYLPFFYFSSIVSTPVSVTALVNSSALFHAQRTGQV